VSGKPALDQVTKGKHWRYSDRPMLSASGTSRSNRQKIIDALAMAAASMNIF
jgi:hypothetical protein